MAGAANLTNAGKGRPKGSVNKNTAAIKDMILQALDEAGGVDYLKARAIDTPTAFLALIGKVLPMQVTGEGGGPISVQTIQLVPLSGDDSTD